MRRNKAGHLYRFSSSPREYSNNSNSVGRRGFSKYLAEYVYRHARRCLHGICIRTGELTGTDTDAGVCNTRAEGRKETWKADRWPARSAAKNTRRNKLKGDVHHIDTTYLAVLSYTFILLLLSSRRLKRNFPSCVEEYRVEAFSKEGF